MKLPPTPEGLSDAGRALWRQTLTDYELAQVDLVVLESFLRQLDRAAEAREAVALAGAYRDGPHGIVAHPGIAVERSATLLASRLLRQLGLPPLAELHHAARSRVA